MKKYINKIKLLIALTLLTLAPVSHGQDLPLNIVKKNWQLLYSDRSPTPYNLTNALIVDFGSYWTGDWDGYLLYNFGQRTNISSFFIEIAGSIICQSNTLVHWDSETFNQCYSTPASIRPIIWSTGNGGTWDYNNRWWGNPTTIWLGTNVAPGITIVQPFNFILTIPLTPDQWSNGGGVQGNSSTTAIAYFKKSLETTINVGVTFGGGCFFGHGLSAETLVTVVFTGYRLKKTQ